MVLCQEIQEAHAEGSQGASASSTSGKVSRRATKRRQPNDLPCSICLCFVDLLIFTQGIYLHINRQLKCHSCTSCVFVLLFPCLSPHSILSFMLSEPLGSLNSSINSSLSCSFPVQTNKMSTTTVVLKGLGTKQNNLQVSLLQASLVSVVCSAAGCLKGVWISVHAEIGVVIITVIIMMQLWCNYVITRDIYLLYIVSLMQKVMLSHNQGSQSQGQCYCISTQLTQTIKSLK